MSEHIFQKFKTSHIGSLPLEDPEEAVELIFETTDIPAWPQLSKFKSENMLLQFNEGLPGFSFDEEILDPESDGFEEALTNFYEDYIKITEEKNLENLKKYLLTDFTAKGFTKFCEIASIRKPEIVKGQITGPFTLAISLKLKNGENPIFREDLKDLILKFISVKALAQGIKLKEITPNVIIFLDEPGLSSFGSSSLITITKEEVLEMLNEVFLLLKDFSIVPGIHICANTSWDIPLTSEVDILSFDSFNFYEKLSIYKTELKEFLSKDGKFIAWGVVPTESSILKNITFEEILHKFKLQKRDLASRIGFTEKEILQKSLFTPACGLGSLNKELCLKALNFLKNFKRLIEDE